MRTGDFGTPMAARRTGLELPLPLQFLAAWLAVWLGRVLQEPIDYLNGDDLRKGRLGDPIERGANPVLSIAKTPSVANDVAVTSVARER